jgi:hypothetical protein
MPLSGPGFPRRRDALRGALWHEWPVSGHQGGMHTAVLVVLGFIGIQAAVGLLVCAYKAPTWIRKRRARRIDEAFYAGKFTVPTSWVREARRHGSGVKR